MYKRIFRVKYDLLIPPRDYQIVATRTHFPNTLPREAPKGGDTFTISNRFLEERQFDNQGEWADHVLLGKYAT